MTDLLLALDQLHFLRPYWLLALPIGLVIGWLLRRRAQTSDWQNFIAPTLLEALLTRPETSSRITPALMVNLMSLCWVLALAGPSWQRLPSPVVDDTAPLVIGLYLNESMLNDDLKPNRLTHAKQKISQLLHHRRGSPTALMIYAGSSHTVLPLTEDVGVLELYLEDLEPRVAPIQGNQPDQLLERASELLGEHGGAVVLVGDDLMGFVPVEKRWSPVKGNVTAAFLSVQELFNSDREILADSLSDADISLVSLTLDDSDIQTIVNTIERRWQYQLQQRDDVQWRDAGYYFIWPLMLLMALFYRRGMVLQWS